MTDTNAAFEVVCQGDTVILTALTDLRELDYQRIESDAQLALEMLDKSNAKNVVLDFSRTEYFGSTALGFFLKLWKRVRARDGHLALCEVSATEKQILSMARLDTLWSICETREQALQAVRQPPV